MQGFKTKSMIQPVRFNSKSFLDLCEPRKVNPWHWKRCLSQCWCQWVLFLWQAGLALELPKQRTNIQEFCPAPAGNSVGGGSWAFQSWLFLQSTVVVLVFPPLRVCSFTASPVDGNFKLLLTSQGLFCEDNVICLQHPRGIHGKTSRALPPAYSATWFTLKGRRTGDRKSIPWQFSYWKVKSNTGKGGLKENIFLLVTGSCFEDKFDSLSCLEITGSLEHVLLLCMILGLLSFNFRGFF